MIKYPDIKRQYGFERIPVEKWLDMMLQNRIEVMDIRLRQMRERLFREPPKPEPPIMVKCPKCDHVFPLTPEQVRKIRHGC